MKKTRFWEDRWLGKESLYLAYPRIYKIAQNHHIAVHDVFPFNLSPLSFRRALAGEKAD